jgi:signal transduction histidine kinase
MKTPVFSLNGYSNMATDMLVSNPERAKVYLSKINEKTLYLGQLMDQISLVTRMDAGVLEMKKTSLNIPDILKHCIDNARVTADSKHIRIIMECEEAAFVIADPIYLTQAIQNVLDNAVIHTGENGEIVLSSEKSPYTMSWLIRIRDNGCGINAEEQGKIFDAYFSNRHGSSPSTGLGLYITSQLLKLNDGGITVSSKEGAGAEFTIFLPAAHVENLLQNM